jgi:hypothetical protein
VKHRSAKVQADLTVIRARAGLVRVRTSPGIAPLTLVLENDI